MNLLNTFARIRVLFRREMKKEIRIVDLSAHMRKDLGIDNINSERRRADRAPRQETYVTFGAVTRAP